MTIKCGLAVNDPRLKMRRSNCLLVSGVITLVALWRLQTPIPFVLTASSVASNDKYATEAEVTPRHGSPPQSVGSGENKIPGDVVAIHKAMRSRTSSNAIALRRRGDPALNYMKRKEALLKEDIQVQLAVFPSWSLSEVELNKRLQKSGKLVDVVMCLSKSYCFSERTYTSLQKLGIHTDRIFGQLDFWSNKKGFCSALNANLPKRQAMHDGGKRDWIRQFSFGCWVLPKDNELLQSSANSAVDGTGWVFKPDNRGGGSGIFVKDGKEALGQYFQRNPGSKKIFVVQEKLQKPLLVKGRKFDLRTHVLVTSVSPMRIYVHKNGVVRFAGDLYSNASVCLCIVLPWCIYNLSLVSSQDYQRTQFLTNLSVNNKGANKVSKTLNCI